MRRRQRLDLLLPLWRSVSSLAITRGQLFRALARHRKRRSRAWVFRRYSAKRREYGPDPKEPPMATMSLPNPGPPNLEFERPADRAHLERTAAALAARGFKAQLANGAEEAKKRVLEAIPQRSEVHIALSETMRALGITSEIDESGRYDSVRSRLSALDRETQGREMRKLGAAPDYIVGSAHAVTDGGEIVVG